MDPGPRRAPRATAASRITSWVESHFTAQTVDGVTVHDLTT